MQGGGERVMPPHPDHTAFHPSPLPPASPRLPQALDRDSPGSRGRAEKRFQVEQIEHSDGEKRAEDLPTPGNERPQADPRVVGVWPALPSQRMEGCPAGWEELVGSQGYLSGAFCSLIFS